MNTCNTCQFWENTATARLGKLRECEYIDWFSERTDKDKANGAFIEADAADDTGLSASLVTGPEFGCIHHTPKQPA